MNCKYNISIPNVGICCKAYYESVRKDGLGWMHFPVCDEANCPLIHSELLEGAILKSEGKNDNID